jgi:hypothetical protein
MKNRKKLAVKGKLQTKENVYEILHNKLHMIFFKKENNGNT